MITCRECGQPVNSDAAACPKCGVSPQKQSMKWLWVPVGLVTAFVFYLANGMIDATSWGPDEKSEKRAAIRICWEEQRRKSLTPGEVLSIASACERMEREFLQRFGVRP